MPRPDLVADCANCEAVCCTDLPFDASESFAIDKAAGEPCPHLARDHRCRIHDTLEGRGFGGCVAFDCHGAGPRATRLFRDGATRAIRDEVFRTLRVVHELLWLLTEAERLVPPELPALATALREEIAALDVIARASLETLLETDVRPREHAAREILRRIGESLGGSRERARKLLVVKAD